MIDVTATATEYASAHATNITARPAPTQVAATGVRHYGLTFDNISENGKPLSRANANIMREIEVTVAKPQMYCATKIKP